MCIDYFDKIFVLRVVALAKCFGQLETVFRLRVLKLTWNIWQTGCSGKISVFSSKVNGISRVYRKRVCANQFNKLLPRGGISTSPTGDVLRAYFWEYRLYRCKWSIKFNGIDRNESNKKKRWSAIKCYPAIELFMEYMRVDWIILRRF